MTNESGSNVPGCSADSSSKASDPADFLISPHAHSRIGKVYGVVSGKGGVGKSFVTSMIASKMNLECTPYAVKQGLKLCR